MDPQDAREAGRPIAEVQELVPVTHGPRWSGVPRFDRFDWILAAICAALVLGSVGVLGAAGLRPSFFAPGFDLILDTTTIAVSAAVARLALVRFRERGERGAIFQASAFLVSAVGVGFALILTLGQVDQLPGASGVAPDQAQLYVLTLARLAMAALLVIGGAVSIRRRDVGRPRAVLAGPALALLGVIVIVQALGTTLPLLSGGFDLVNPAGPGASLSFPPTSTLPGALAQLGTAVLFLWAAALYRLLYRRDGRTADAFLATGLLIAGFSQVHLAAYPEAFAGLVTSGDLLGLAFDVMLLFGIEAEVVTTLGELRRTNQRLELLKSAEADRAALEERARLSRELHDGLAQDLWFAKLKAGRLCALPDLGPEAAELCDELAGAIDAGLADARQAVMALRLGGDGTDAPLSELMRRYVDDFADRFGVPTEFGADEELPRLSLRTEAELLRIAQEALSNVHRHADATLVRVQISFEEGKLAMTVRDNGRGFDAVAVADGSFGLASMRERAAIIGGRLEIESHPSDGTRVTIEVPLAGAIVARSIAP